MHVNHLNGRSETDQIINLNKLQLFFFLDITKICLNEQNKCTKNRTKMFIMFEINFYRKQKLFNYKKKNCVGFSLLMNIIQCVFFPSLSYCDFSVVVMCDFYFQSLYRTDQCAIGHSK